MGANPAEVGFPFDKVEAARRFLYAVKPWWARFGSKMVVVPTYREPPPGARWGAMASTDAGFRLYVDRTFATLASLSELAGAIEHEYQHHTRDTWRRLRWLSLDEWARWANIALDLEINDKIAAESAAISDDVVAAAISRSSLFRPSEAARWAVVGPPSLAGLGAWVPTEVGMPTGLSAEAYLEILMRPAPLEEPEPEPEEQSDDHDEELEPDDEEPDDEEPERRRGDDDQQDEAQEDEAQQDEQDFEPPFEDESADAPGQEQDPQEGQQDADEQGQGEQGQGDDQSEGEQEVGEGPGSDQEGQDAGQDAGAGQEPSGTGQREQGAQEQDGAGARSGDSEAAAPEGPDPEQGAYEEGNDVEGDGEPGGDGGDQRDAPEQRAADLALEREIARAVAAKRADPQSALWASEIDNPEDPLRTPGWKPAPGVAPEAVNPGQVAQALADLAEDVREAASGSMAGARPGQALVAWEHQRRKVRGLDWSSRLSRLLAAAVSSAKMAGASDISYQVRNPHQPRFGAILPGVHDYAPTVTVIQDVSASMLANEAMSTSMSVFTDLVTTTLGRFSTPVTWIAVDSAVVDVGSATAWSPNLQRRWSRGFGGTVMTPTIIEVMTGVFRHKRVAYRAPDLLVVCTDCQFNWPARRPSRSTRLVVVSVAPTGSEQRYLPPWLDQRRELIVVDP